MARPIFARYAVAPDLLYATDAMNRPAFIPPLNEAQQTVFGVIFGVSFAHLLNDMMQALLPAIYPTLKTTYRLNFAEIGFITLAFQLTASLLQPLVGLAADRRPMPYALPLGMVSTLVGLLMLSLAQSYAMILMSAAAIGLGSSVFHPECSRVARMAAGTRRGLAQSIFQLGGNIGSALGPFTAAFIVLAWGQRSIAFYALAALAAIFILWRIAVWYKKNGIARMQLAHSLRGHATLPHKTVRRAIAILLLLIFSKYIYLTSINSFFTFFLIQKFHLTVRSAQLHLFLFLAAIAAGTFIGGPIGDRVGRKYVIWFSILGALPFTLALPFANLFWTGVFSAAIGVIMASAFSAIVVYGQELVPGRVGMIAGMFFGFSFGMAAVGAAVLGLVADRAGIAFVYRACALLPLLGVFAVFLPDIEAPVRAGDRFSDQME